MSRPIAEYDMCVHCMLGGKPPRSISDIADAYGEAEHGVVAFANGGEPQRAWFPEETIIAARQGVAIDPHWEYRCNENHCETMTLTVAPGGKRYIWKLTDTYAKREHCWLGVWAD